MYKNTSRDIRRQETGSCWVVKIRVRQREDLGLASIFNSLSHTRIRMAGNASNSAQFMRVHVCRYVLHRAKDSFHMHTPKFALFACSYSLHLDPV